MDEPEMFNTLRAEGVDADQPEIREAVRGTLDLVDRLEERTDVHTARQCMTAMRAALKYRLLHPDIDDMSNFESEFDVETDGDE